MKKKIMTVVLATLVALIFVAPNKPAEAQQMYCGHCCDISPYTGGPRIRCTLVQDSLCGTTCACLGIAGYGFACY